MIQQYALSGELLGETPESFFFQRQVQWGWDHVGLVQVSRESTGGHGGDPKVDSAEARISGGRVSRQHPAAER